MHVASPYVTNMTCQLPNKRPLSHLVRDPILTSDMTKIKYISGG